MQRFISSLRKTDLVALAILSMFLINPFGFGFVFGYLLVLWVVLQPNLIAAITGDTMFWTLLLFSVVYGAFYALNPEQGIQYIIIYLTFPWTFYLLGKNMGAGVFDRDAFYILFFLIATFYSITPILSIGKNILNGGFVQFSRDIPNFWNGKIEKATLIAIPFAFQMLILAFLYTKKQYSKYLFNIAALLIFVLAMLCTFRIGSRTLLMVFFITSLLAFFLFFNKSSIGVKTLSLILMLIAAVYMIDYIYIDLNSDYLSVLGQRLQDSDNAQSAGGRTERWMSSVENLIEHPLGWKLSEFGFAHNFWLDVARENGLLPLGILILFTIQSLKLWANFITNNLHDNRVIYLSLGFFVTSYSILFLEPIMNGAFDFFCVFCLVHGWLKGLKIMENHEIAVR
ncbi:O-antigen ligase family protein [Robertkochia sediminum]|uniref:O-antigen ligase family protein n=1 Tax=Robertkochia sediminum TaxID=2785326 RepID=UPI0019329AF3|nr:O-antigen ligase family protein [Robertkochia sediminum]MBL7474042.1 hypothetical protein [Robertkochia sediminum]